MKGQYLMEKSFTILIQEHYHMLFCFAMTFCNDSALAEDIVQESFLTAYQRIDNFDPARNFGSWIRGTARKKAMNEFRKSRRIKLLNMKIIQNTIESNFSVSYAEQDTCWTEKIKVLKQCLKKADGLLRKIVELYYSESACADDIAKETGMSVDTVWQRLSRGRRSLKSCIEKHLALPGGGS